MNGLAPLLSIVEDVIQYLVPGYIFVGCMNFVACRKREADSTNFIIECIAISYALAVFGSILPIQCLDVHGTQLLYAVAGGLFLGFCFRSKLVDSFIRNCFKIGMNENLFVELNRVAKSGVVVLIKRKNDLGTYCGVLHEVLDPYGSPSVILEKYYYIDSKDGESIAEKKDHRRHTNIRLVIDYADVESFEFVLPKESNK